MNRDSCFPIPSPTTVHVSLTPYGSSSTQAWSHLQATDFSALWTVFPSLNNILLAFSRLCSKIISGSLSLTTLFYILKFLSDQHSLSFLLCFSAQCLIQSDTLLFIYSLAPIPETTIIWEAPQRWGSQVCLFIAVSLTHSAVPGTQQVLST